MTLTVRSASVTGATTAGRELTYSEVDANWAHVIQASNQSFTPSGTGAPSRTVQAKLREAKSVLDYNSGIVGDGSTDDSTALTNLLTAQPDSITSYYVPDNVNLNIASDVTLPANISLFGPGKITGTGNLIISSTKNIVHGLDLTVNVLLDSGAGGLTAQAIVSGNTFRTRGSGDDCRIGIVTTSPGSPNGLLSSVIIEDNVGYGGSNALQTAGKGLIVFEATNNPGYVKNITIRRNRAFGYWKGVLYFTGQMTYSSVTHNYAEDCETGILWLSQAASNTLRYRNSVVGNVFEGNEVVNNSEEGISFDCNADAVDSNPVNKTIPLATLDAFSATSGNQDRWTVKDLWSATTVTGITAPSDEYVTFLTGRMAGRCISVGQSISNQSYIGWRNERAKVGSGDVIAVGSVVYGNSIKANTVRCSSSGNLRGIVLYGRCFGNTVEGNTTDGDIWDRGVCNGGDELNSNINGFNRHSNNTCRELYVDAIMYDPNNASPPSGDNTMPYGMWGIENMGAIIRDNSAQELTLGRLIYGAATPTGNTTETWYDTGNSAFKNYNGSSWASIGSSDYARFPAHKVSLHSGNGAFRLHDYVLGLDEDGVSTDTAQTRQQQTVIYVDERKQRVTRGLVVEETLAHYFHMLGNTQSQSWEFDARMDNITGDGLGGIIEIHGYCDNSNSTAFLVNGVYSYAGRRSQSTWHVRTILEKIEDLGTTSANTHLTITIAAGSTAGYLKITVATDGTIGAAVDTYLFCTVRKKGHRTGNADYYA